MAKYYVTMTDKNLSGWGKAKGRISKLVFPCDNGEEVEIVMNNAENREGMLYINWSTKFPQYRVSKYTTEIADKEKYGNWYKKGHFKNGR